MVSLEGKFFNFQFTLVGKRDTFISWTVVVDLIFSLLRNRVFEQVPFEKVSAVRILKSSNQVKLLAAV